MSKKEIATTNALTQPRVQEGSTITIPRRTVFCLIWEESERGWGVRPDGYSFHRTEADARAYVDDYWKTMPDSAPDEYERPSSSTLYTYDVEEKVFRDVSKSKNGIRVGRSAVRGDLRRA